MLFVFLAIFWTGFNLVNGQCKLREVSPLISYYTDDDRTVKTAILNLLDKLYTITVQYI